MKKRKIVGICSSVGNKAKATNNTYPIIFINRIFIEISHSYNLIPIILSPTVDISEIEQMANMIDFLNQMEEKSEYASTSIFKSKGLPLTKLKAFSTSLVGFLGKSLSILEKFLAKHFSLL